MSAHARLSPSDSPRWMTCPGAVLLEESMCLPKDPGSSYAAEGTAAHDLGEKAFLSHSSPHSFIGQTVKGFEVDRGMADAVEVYTDFLNSLVLDRNSGCEVGKVWYETEKRLDITAWIPEGFGSSDFVFYDANLGILDIVDYKHGQGVTVEAEDNPQMMIYALGALTWLNKLADKTGEVDPELCSLVRCTIVQPRARHSAGPVRTAEVPVEDLLDFGDAVKKAADYIYDSPGRAIHDFNAGEKQCRWCRALPMCPEAARVALEAATMDFDAVMAGEGEDSIVFVPRILSVQEAAYILDHTNFIKKFLLANEARLQEELEKGRPVPGYKLVAGRSTRKWNNPDTAMVFLDAFLTEDQYAPRKIVSLPQAEKLLGKETKALLVDYTEKPPGKPTIAKESDPRKALRPDAKAQEDFDEVK